MEGVRYTYIQILAIARFKQEFQSINQADSLFDSEYATCSVALSRIALTVLMRLIRLVAMPEFHHLGPALGG